MIVYHDAIYCIFRLPYGNGCVISLCKPTPTLQPKVLGYVWCTLSHYLFPKAMDNQTKKNTVAIIMIHMCAVYFRLVIACQ